VFNSPANLSIPDVWIAGMVELKRKRGIGRWTENVLGLVDIR
jgi:hypothetical protein